MDRRYLSGAIWHGDLEYFNLDENKIKDLYFTSFEKEHAILRKGSLPGLDYFFNWHGYRSPEFISNPDILTLGCSFTEGDGISDIKNTWSSVLAEKMGMSYNSVSRSGDSVGSQVRKAFAFFRQFGNPKYVFAIFPDMYRFEYPYNKDKLVYHKKNVEDLDQQYIRISHWTNDYSNNQKYSKLPHRINDIVGDELRHFYNINYIWMLEQYCISNGIEFTWSFWNYIEIDLIDYLRNMEPDRFKNFVDIENHKWLYDDETGVDRLFVNRPVLPGNHNNHEIICHQEFKGLPDFELGLDRHHSHPHPGFHRHMHWAEIFYNKVMGKK